MKAVDLLTELINEKLTFENIVLGETLSLYAKRFDYGVKVLKGKFNKSSLYYMSRSNNTLQKRPDVTIDNFGTKLHYWEIEM